ncbi:SGNH/GDSL hydrolase family protein [Flagellimonas sp. S174]|uniref:SGNH/GDSL hydrolase family protein n=1 Tax=Flagellimonas sp. S174 TaxID=3410790 RepID=UPI003BF4A07F
MSISFSCSMLKKGICLLIFVLSVIPVKSQKAGVNSKHVKVLFIGNSLTYYNNLPELVKGKALQKDIRLDVDMIAYPNYALIDHWEDGKAQKMIKQEKYDFVLIQQGPSSQPYGREVLFDYGRRFKSLCDTYGGQLIFLMVWPSQNHYSTFDAVIKNHEDAVRTINAGICPVGKVWKKHFDSTNDYSYYGQDGFHPSLKGSQVAAEIIVSCLF